MKGHTHILGGIVLTEAVLAVAGPLPHAALILAAGAIGGLVPDWDHPGSTLGRWIPWPAVSRSRGPYVPPDVGRIGFPHPIWHRHQAHSLVGIGVANGLLTGIGAWGWSALQSVSHGGFLSTASYPWAAILLGLMIGSLSHLVLDGFNQTPQWWLWPFSRRGFRWPIHASMRAIDAPVSAVLMLVLVLWDMHSGSWQRW